MKSPFDPIAFHLFGSPVTWYWLFYPTSFLIVVILGFRYRDREFPEFLSTHFLDHCLWSWIGLIVGGRLGYVLFYNFEFFVGHPRLIYQFWLGGMSFHGAIIGLIGANGIYSALFSKAFWRFFDIIAIYAPIGLFFGRIGNFLNGELWGRPTTMPWGFYFNQADNQLRHPSQLYEAATEGILLLLVMQSLTRKNRRPGELAVAFLFFYSLFRFFTEFFREADRQLGYFLSLSLGQWFCILSIVFCTVLWKKKYSR